MNRGMVCVGQFDEFHVASVARSRLQVEGIQVVLRNMQMIGTGVRAFIPGLYSSLGGALLYVPSSQADRAIAILREVDPAAVCTRSIRRPPSALRGALKLLLAITFLVLLAGVLVFLAPKN